jgi:hypothetical protein
MTLAELADLFFIIFAVVYIGAAIFFVVISFLIFRRIRDILDSSQTIAANIRIITSAITEDLIKPLASIASVVQGISKVLDFISDRKKDRRKGD